MGRRLGLLLRLLRAVSRATVWGKKLGRFCGWLGGREMQGREKDSEGFVFGFCVADRERKVEEQ